ncbi:hypothetical protein [Variovorax sp.]|uniref:hypothetical protein n=1 Tax=Variovorax sp. TaxID=1871043 RepID=UPI003BABF679
MVTRVGLPSKTTSMTLSSSDSAWNSAVRWLKRSLAAGESFRRGEGGQESRACQQRPAPQGGRGCRRMRGAVAHVLLVVARS